MKNFNENQKSDFDVEGLKEDIKSTAADVKDKAKEAAHGIGDHVSETAGKVKEQVKEQFDEYSEDIVEYVKENPLKSVLFAIAAGVVLSKTLM